MLQHGEVPQRAARRQADPLAARVGPQALHQHVRRPAAADQECLKDRRGVQPAGGIRLWLENKRASWIPPPSHESQIARFCKEFCNSIYFGLNRSIFIANLLLFSSIDFQANQSFIFLGSLRGCPFVTFLPIAKNHLCFSHSKLSSVVTNKIILNPAFHLFQLSAKL